MGLNVAVVKMHKKYKKKLVIFKFFDCPKIETSNQKHMNCLVGKNNWTLGYILSIFWGKFEVPKIAGYNPYDLKNLH